LRTAAALALILSLGAARAAQAGETPYVFEAQGQKIDAFRGEFEVPENRANPQSRNIKLAYVRFPSTGAKPGAPIVYLAGGPGGSGIGTAAGERFPLFMKLREAGDVIAFDQRGTGASNFVPPCKSGIKIGLDEPGDEARVVAAYRAAAAACSKYWTEAGVDIGGYDTMENARDLDALRQALGAEKISLWAISYGTHLAYAAVKTMNDRIERIVLTGSEGPDDTVKLPSQSDLYFGRLQASIDSSPKARALYPDIEAMLRRVLARLQTPVEIVLPAPAGELKFKLARFEAQLLLGYSLADPESALRALTMFKAADEGDFTPLAGAALKFLRSGKEEIELRGMPDLTDVASGISKPRLARVTREARTAIVGDALNFPMPHLSGAFGDIELPPSFRRLSKTSVPTLLIIGTLDGRTFPAEQRKDVSRFSNVEIVTFENAGHNLFVLNDEIQQTILDFMQGAPPPKPAIATDFPALQ
jgi:pimeloyl-ACP methyl ester carboxylesterase